MTVLLQGGGEFSLGCRDMDRQLLALAPGPVVVTALAGAPGREYRTATGNGVDHYRACGAEDVAGAPDVREDAPGALAALRRARLVVLPGGSPARLLAALSESGIGSLLADLLEQGGAVMGASAGAMVLGSWTVLPGRRLDVVPGLGLVPGIAVVPHWSGAREDWVERLVGVPAPPRVLGLPEESGVLLHHGAATAVGQRPTTVVDGPEVAPGALLPPWSRHAPRSPVRAPERVRCETRRVDEAHADDQEEQQR